MTPTHKNILLCVTGLTPQIVTETLYCLAVQQKLRIHELHILTTQRGLTVILGKDKGANTPNTPLLKELRQLCKDNSVSAPQFSPEKHVRVAKEESIELHDVRTDKENRLFPNKALELVRELTALPNTTLYCSISGGRKSMGVHLAFAFALFARPQDRLLHVLTDESLESKNFYPKSSAEAKALMLAELPVVPLRPLLARYNGQLNPADMSFTGLVEHARKEIAVLADPGKLLVDLRERRFIFMNHTVNVEPQLLAVYYYFVKHLHGGLGKLSKDQLCGRDAAHEIAEFMGSNFNVVFSPPDKNDRRSTRHWSVAGFPVDLLRTVISKINAKIDVVAPSAELGAQFRIDSERVYGNTKYYINCKPDKIKIMGI